MQLVTGGTGFIGSHLLQAMARSNASEVVMLGRRPVLAGKTRLAALDDRAALRAACHGVQVLFHCAGHAHAFAALSDADAEQHWRVNFEGTRNLAEAAGQAGVQRFVFLSSVKAMADPGEVCADEDFSGRPDTAYGQSKRAAEEAVLDAGRQYGMHVVNLRLAMVYGHGGRGNLERMGRLVQQGWFPPLPETGNHRSLVHIDDVVAVMQQVAGDSRADGRTYIIAGPDAPSGRQLYDTMRNVLGLPPRYWSVPERVLRGFAWWGDRLEDLLQRRIPYNSEVLDRLLGSAWYSGDRIARELGWRAKVSLRKGLEEMFR